MNPQEHSTPAQAKAWTISCPNHVAKMIYMYLAFRMKPDGFVNSSINNIRKHTGLSKAAVCKQLNVLASHGHIIRSYRGSCTKRTMYQLPALKHLSNLAP